MIICKCGRETRLGIIYNTWCRNCIKCNVKDNRCKCNKIKEKNAVLRYSGETTKLSSDVDTWGWNYVNKSNNIKERDKMTKITYFNGDRELYSHNLDADKIMIDGKIVWWKVKEFNRGDKVKWSYAMVTKFGIFESFEDDSHLTSFVRFDSILWVVKTDELTKIDEPQLKIGDYVRVNNNRLFDYQQTGKVIEVTKYQCLVEFSDYNIERINRKDNWELSKEQNNGHLGFHSKADLEKVK